MRRALVLVVVLALSACGGSSSKTAGGGSKPAGAQTPRSLSVRLGCTGYTDDAEAQLYTREDGSCTSPSLRIATFSTSALRDQWLKVAEGFGGTYAVGSTWVVYGDSAKDVSAAATTLGVSVKP